MGSLVQENYIPFQIGSILLQFCCDVWHIQLQIQKNILHKKSFLQMSYQTSQHFETMFLTLTSGLAVKEMKKSLAVKNRECCGNFNWKQKYWKTNEGNTLLIIQIIVFVFDLFKKTFYLVKRMIHAKCNVSIKFRRALILVL